MGSFEQQFCPEHGGWWLHFLRNIRLIRYLFGLAWGWLIAGGRTRRALRAKEAADEIFWLD